MMLVSIFPLTYRYCVLPLIFLVVFYHIVRCANFCNNLAWIMQPPRVYLIVALLPLTHIIFPENRIISNMIFSACIRHTVLASTVTDSLVFRNVQTNQNNVQNYILSPLPGEF
jgi:hypothetical protein